MAKPQQKLAVLAVCGLSFVLSFVIENESMPVSTLNFQLIKAHLLIFAGSLIITASLLVGVTVFVNSTRQMFTQINQSVSIDKETLQKRLEGNDLYHAIQQKYRSLFADDVNPSDKLRWMEQLQLQAERLSLPALTYNIKARQSDTEINATLTDGFSVYATPIELKIGLVHEEQLLRLADNLLLAGLGTFNFEYCELKLHEKNKAFKPASNNLEAECLIKWYEIVRTETMDAELAARVTP